MEQVKWEDTKVVEGLVNVISDPKTGQKLAKKKPTRETPPLTTQVTSTTIETGPLPVVSKSTDSHPSTGSVTVTTEPPYTVSQTVPQTTPPAPVSTTTPLSTVFTDIPATTAPSPSVSELSPVSETPTTLPISTLPVSEPLTVSEPPHSIPYLTEILYTTMDFSSIHLLPSTVSTQPNPIFTAATISTTSLHPPPSIQPLTLGAGTSSSRFIEPPFITSVTLSSSSDEETDTTKSLK